MDGPGAERREAAGGGEVDRAPPSRADAAAGKGKSGSPATASAARSTDPAGKAAAAKAAVISGQVSLSPALASAAGPDDTLFVFARAAEGPRAPLAVLRARVKDLPLAFTLDDSMAMSPELRLSRFPQVRVEARISRTGTASAQSGDLQGASAVVSSTTAGLKVVIDQKLP